MLLQMAESLDLKVQTILTETKAKQVDIVAHSLGGVVARFYMTFGPGRGLVRNLVTLGTPHQGTEMSFVARGLNVGTLAQDLKVNSYLMRSLRETALPKDSFITSLYSAGDWTLVPAENGIAAGVPEKQFRSVCLTGVGHAGLLFHQETFDTVVQSLLSRSRMKGRS